MRWISKLRPSPAMVVALIALFVAMGGVGYAAAKIGSRQIKNNSVLGKDIRNSTITGKDVKNNSLTGRDIVESKLGQVPSAKTADTANTVGPNGVNTTAIQDNAVTTTKIADNAVTNTKIADNAVTTGKIADANVTAADVGTTTQAVGASTPIGASGNASAVVQCPAGTQVLSGGGGTNSALVFGVESFQSGNGWLWYAHNSEATAHTIYATAVCLR